MKPAFWFCIAIAAIILNSVYGCAPHGSLCGTDYAQEDETSCNPHYQR
jgi:hypothetical protein